jgi:hypothetical protein
MKPDLQIVEISFQYRSLSRLAVTVRLGETSLQYQPLDAFRYMLQSVTGARVPCNGGLKWACRMVEGCAA